MQAPDWFDNKGGPARSRPPPPQPPDKNDPATMAPSAFAKATFKAPPPLPGRSGAAASAASGTRSLPTLPSLPSVPSAPGQIAGQAGGQLALPPPPGAPPSLAALPQPPPPPGAPGTTLALPGVPGGLPTSLLTAAGATVPRTGQTGGGAGGGVIATQFAQAMQDAMLRDPKVQDAIAVHTKPVADMSVGQLGLRSIVKAKPPVQDEKPFEIWGLQNRAYSIDELREAFEMLDLDRRGHIGMQDMRRVLDLTGEGDVTNIELREMLRLVDSDARGKVDFDEFADQFLDPPAVFRNFDMHKREGVMVKAEMPRGSYVSSAASAKGDDFVADLRGDAVKSIMGKRKLTPEFIKTIYQRFVELDVDERGFISFQDFCFILRRSENEDMQWAFDVFDHAHLGELDLRQFIVGISMYTSSSTEEKLKFAFMMFDEEQNEEVPHSDVELLFLSIAPHLVEEVRQAHEQRMYQLLNLHPSMGIQLEEFLDYCLEYADELVPATPSPSTGSQSRSSGSSYTSTPRSGMTRGSQRSGMSGSQRGGSQRSGSHL